jgi:hypothetical protein
MTTQDKSVGRGRLAIKVNDAYMWHLYLAPLFGTFIWHLYLAPLFGTFTFSGALQLVRGTNTLEVYE